MTNLLSNRPPTPLPSPGLYAQAGPEVQAHPNRLVQPIVIQSRIAFAVLILAGCTLGLMALGSATRVMNAGLSCPDWPLCYGTLVPSAQMNLQVFLEWFHRLVATSVGFSILVLSVIVLRYRQQLPTWLPGATGGALALVICQGMLGGLTVTELLRFDIVTAHLGTGLAFFSTLLTIGLCLRPYPAPVQPVPAVRSLGWLGAIAASLVYIQSLLGGLVGSQWAVHQCFGQAQLCDVMNRHIFGVVPATIAIVSLLGWGRRIRIRAQRPLHPWLMWCFGAIATLLTLQIGLGVTTFRLHLQVEILTVLHQAVGAALLGALLAATVLAFRQPAQPAIAELATAEPIAANPVTPNTVVTDPTALNCNELTLS
jgi:heme a synthase